MSGWGMAEGMTNRVVLPCESHDEALIVAQNAENRAEMKRVAICSTKPRARRGTLYSVLTRDDAERWFTPGGFAPEPRRRFS
jgi:hypothetical protein